MKTLSRRTFLRGTGGVALGLPLLEVMLPGMARAQSQPGVPKRVIFVFKANGDQIARRFDGGGETTFQLGEFLQPLDPYRNELLFLDGLDKRFSQISGERSDNHQQGGAGLAPWRSGSGSFPIGGGGGATVGYVEGPSIDYAIGSRILAAEPTVQRRHLVFRVGQRNVNIWNVASHGGPAGTQNPITPETDPYRAYSQLFDGFDTGAPRGAVLRRLAKRQSALDLVTAENARLRAQLGVADRQRLDRHTDSLREIERSLQDPSTVGACAPLDMGTPLDPYDDANHAEIGRLFFQVSAMALACDMTRSISFAWSGNTSGRVYRNVSVGGSSISEGHHDISHNADGAAFDKIRAIKRHLWTQSTGLYEELKALPEVGGTVWDNTLVVHWDELGQGNTHDTRDQLVVFGGGRGVQSYFRMGRHLDLRNTANNAYGDMLVSCFHWMGFEDVDVFGDPRLSSGGPLPGLT